MRLNLLLTIGFLGLCAVARADTAPPVVVELFTSTNCPNCPSTEAKMDDLAAQTPDILVVAEHVDYWNNGDHGAKPDPWSSPDFTQRQYDYSNRLSERPGAVFTPQPVLDGRWVATPPLWFNWNGTLDKARKAEPKAGLELVKGKDGLTVRWPQGAALQNTQLVVLGLVTDEKHSHLWRATGVNMVDVEPDAAKDGQRLAGAMLPKGDKVLILWQESNAGAVKGVGLSQ